MSPRNPSAPGRAAILTFLFPTALLVIVGSSPKTQGHDMVMPGPASRDITITVKVDLIGGDDKLAQQWKNAFENYWNRVLGGGPFLWCGKTIHFVADVAPKKGAPRPGADQIKVKRVRAGRTFRSRLRDVPDDPTTEDTPGIWRSNADDATIAHEFGHLLGLHDEYDEDTGETSAEFRGDSSIMSADAHRGGQVLLRHVDAVMRKHHLTVPDCLWVREKTEDHRINGPAVGGTEVWVYVNEATLLADARGSLRGEGTHVATGWVRGRYHTLGDPHCWSNDEWFAYTRVSASGTRASTHVRVDIMGHARMVGKILITTCPLGTGSTDYSINHHIEGDLHDGKYGHRDYGPINSGGYAIYTIVIEDRSR